MGSLEARITRPPWAQACLPPSLPARAPAPPVDPGPQDLCCCSELGKNWKRLEGSCSEAAGRCGREPTERWPRSRATRVDGAPLGVVLSARRLGSLRACHLPWSARAAPHGQRSPPDPCSAPCASRPAPPFVRPALPDPGPRPPRRQSPPSGRGPGWAGRGGAAGPGGGARRRPGCAPVSRWCQIMGPRLPLPACLVLSSLRSVIRPYVAVARS